MRSVLEKGIQPVPFSCRPACPHQAFRFGTTAWGLQFHPEVTEQIIRDWSAWDPATTCQTESLVAAFLDQADDYRSTAKLNAG